MESHRSHQSCTQFWHHSLLGHLQSAWQKDPIWYRWQALWKLLSSCIETAGVVRFFLPVLHLDKQVCQYVLVVEDYCATQLYDGNIGTSNGRLFYCTLCPMFRAPWVKQCNFNPQAPLFQTKSFKVENLEYCERYVKRNNIKARQHSFSNIPWHRTWDILCIGLRTSGCVICRWLHSTLYLLLDRSHGQGLHVGASFL